jgi:hypothetical protein
MGYLNVEVVYWFVLVSVVFGFGFFVSVIGFWLLLYF